MGSITPVNVAEHCAAPGRWAAELSLRFAQTARGSRLVHSHHQGPLYVQKPFYPEGPNCAHVYLLHPPGGMVSGDHLQISVDVGSAANALLTTPGASRIYRARPDKTEQRQRVDLHLEEGSALEWLPLETIVYPASNGSTATCVHLPANGQAKFMGWEITCLGLPASQFPFASGQLKQSFELWAGAKPLLLEKLRLNGQDTELMQGLAGLQGNPVTGLMVAGPFNTDFSALDSDLLKSVRAQLGNFNGLGVTQRKGFILIRYLGPSAEHARRLFTEAWTCLRPVLVARAATAPRIWAC